VRRREFITLLGGSAATWPLAVRAQQLDRTRRIGVIMGFAEDDQVWQFYLATFRQRLQDFGWSEGRNIRFDYRFTGAHSSAPQQGPLQPFRLSSPRNIYHLEL
jgi:putative tryptophan/tyrosine transport system substrate-binding protein